MKWLSIAIGPCHDHPYTRSVVLTVLSIPAALVGTTKTVVSGVADECVALRIDRDGAERVARVAITALLPVPLLG